jgi:hypothetical protein
MSEDRKKGSQLPYNLDITLFDKMLNEIKNLPSEGIKQTTLWTNLGEAINSNRSYTLNLAKYLRLIERDSTDVILTELGIKCIRYATGEQRKISLAKSMPEEYMAMFKWIKNASELKSNEIKQKFIDTWGQSLSSIVLDKAIATFLNYCQYLKLLRYIGKGNQARAVMTDFGKKVLDAGIIDEPEKPHEAKHEPNEPQTTVIQLSKNATYPIIIKTNDRDFDWDVKSESDWAVIDSVIASIKEGWRKSNEQ